MLNSVIINYKQKKYKSSNEKVTNKRKFDINFQQIIKNLNKVFYFYEKNDIIIMIHYYRVSINMETYKQDKILNSIALEYIVKNQHSFNNIIDFKCEPIFINGECFIKFYILSSSSENIMQFFKEFNNEYKSKPFNLDNKKLLEYINVRHKDYNFLTWFYNNNFVSVRNELNKSDSKFFICCNDSCKDMAYEGYVKFINKSLDFLNLCNVQKDIPRKKNYKTYSFNFSGYQYSVVAIMALTILKEYLLKSLRFSENAYCYNILHNIQKNGGNIQLNYIVEMGNIEQCDVCFSKIEVFLKCYNFSKEGFLKNKKNIYKNYYNHKPFYKNFEEKTKEHFFDNYMEQNIIDIQNLEFELFLSEKEKIVENSIFSFKY